MIGKYPRRLENLNRVDGCLSLRLCEVRFSSNAKINPKSVTVRAVNFR